MVVDVPDSGNRRSASCGYSSHDVDKTMEYLRTCISITMVLCVIGALTSALYVGLYSREAADTVLPNERTFIVFGVMNFVLLFFGMFMLRKHWPVNVFVSDMIRVWTGFVFGFLLCTHLKLIIHGVERNL